MAVLYDFICPNCGAEFEAKKEIDGENPQCLKCKAITEVAYRNKPVVRFKGTGFHCNDYDFMHIRD